MKKLLVTLLIVVSFAGVLDTAYLTANHYNDSLPAGCSVGGHGISRCDVVLSSKYSVVAGVPLAVLGLVYYLLLFVLSTILVTNSSKKIVHAIAGVSGVGFIVSLWFVYLQLFVLNAICLYCMGSVLSTTLLFVISLYYLRLYKSSPKNTQL